MTLFSVPENLPDPVVGQAQLTGIKPHRDPREFGAKSNTPSSMPIHTLYK